MPKQQDVHASSHHSSTVNYDHQPVVAAKLASSFDALAQQIEDTPCREGRAAQKAAALVKLSEARSYLGDFIE